MTRLSIPEMSCGHCRATIERVVKAIDPLAALTFDMETRQLDLHSVADLPTLQAALRAEGYATQTA